MTENLQTQYIFIQNYENLIYYVNNDDEKYIYLIQMNCDKNTIIDNLKLLDNTTDILFYLHMIFYVILKLYLTLLNQNACKLIYLLNYQVVSNY